jgi:hypothetical protein
MTLAGLLLIAATVLKCHEMIDTCIPSWDVKMGATVRAVVAEGERIPYWKANIFGFWESYEFFLIQIPLEFALGVWLVCGLFRKAAWVAGTLAYLGFIGVTLIKAVTGAESCGCFGQIHVNPWITLFVIDIPFFLLLAICRPKGYKLLPPWPNMFYLLAVAVPTIGLMVLAAPALVTFRPDCIKAEDKQPDESAQLKLQIHKLKQNLTSKDQEINQLQKQISKIQIQDVQYVDSLADPNRTHWMVRPTNIEHDTLEIYINQHHMLSINFDNPDQVILSMIDPEQQTMKFYDDGRVELCWIEKQEPEQVDVTPPVNDTSDTPPVVEQWDWLEFVVEDDVREQISEGLVVVMMHRFNCEVCEEMAPRYSEYYQQLVDQDADEFKIAFLAVPPYGDEDHVPEDTACINGNLTDEKDWLVMSPLVVALLDGELMKTWEQGTAPAPENLLEEVFGE